MGLSATVAARTPTTLTCQFGEQDDGPVPLSGLLVQDGLDSSPAAIDSALASHWYPIWNRDTRREETDLECWSGYMSLLRRCTSPCPGISVDMQEEGAWLHVVRRLSPHKSTGVCGWHNADLRQLPSRSIKDLAFILGSPVHTQFPAHLMRARVALLGKIENPTEAAHTRPITIMSNLFRVWGRVLCTQVLQVWSRTLPSSVQGCLRERCSSDLCYWLQSETEAALARKRNCTGVAVDLRRAFNTLPRCPLRATLQWLGLPEPVCSLWTRSLASVERTFCVQASLGAYIPSTTGAPEGDPVSVLGMTSFCVVYGDLLQPYVQPRSFVDNWGWTASGRQKHLPAVRELTSLAGSLRLQIDWSKSYCFATCPEARKWLRTHSADVFPDPIPLLSQVKELGAHLQFNRHRMLGHLPVRIKEANRRLHCLYNSSAPLESKALAIQSSIWPATFFGAHALAPGKQRLNMLRGNAARVLAGRHHTLSPHAALYLLPTVQDPEPFIMIQQARMLRRCFHTMPDVASSVLAMASGPEPSSVFGPASAIRTMFGRNDWTLSPDGWFKGPGHSRFNVRTASPAAISQAVLRSWGHAVQQACLHRNGLHQMPLPCRDRTVKVLRHFKPWEQLMLARHVSGGFMSHAEKASWSADVLDLCPLCGAKDTKFHRLYECSPLSTVREPYAHLLQQVQRHRPWWTHLFMASEHDDAFMFRLISTSRQLPPLVNRPAPGFVQLFSDGAARHSSSPTARLIYWSVVQACGPSSPVSPTDWVRLGHESRRASFSVVCMGATPGEQTVPRAELAALAWAARWLGNQPGFQVEVHSDSQFVVDTWHRLQRGEPLTALAHPDLAEPLVGVRNFSVLKVKAHNDAGSRPTAAPSLQWATAGNIAADSAAAAARGQEMRLLRDLSDSLAEHDKLEYEEMLSFARYLVEVNVYEVKLKEVERLQRAEDEADSLALPMEIQVGGSREPPEAWVSLVPHGLPPCLQDLLWGNEFVSAVYSWAASLQWPPLPQPSTTDSVTFLELFSHFTVWSNLLPPAEIPVRGRRQFVSARSLGGSVQPRSLEQAVGVFMEVIQSVRRQHGIVLLPNYPVIRLHHLRLLGLDTPQNGLAVRPLFSSAAGWVPLLRELCTRHALQPVIALVRSTNQGRPHQVP